MRDQAFDFIDAVVLYAIAWAGTDGANPEILEPFLQHLDALPTSVELNTALSKLMAVGLVRAEGQRVFASRRAIDLFESVVHLPARTVPQHFAELLATVSVPQIEMRVHFSEQEQRAARNAYHRRLRDALRNVNGPVDR